MTDTHDTVPGGPTPPPGSPPSPAGGQRLVRLTDHQKISGVAAGLGYYFGVDPTLVRVAFVVTGLLSFGLAVAVYGVMWWLLPPSTVERSGLAAPRPGAGRIQGFQVAAVVVGIVMLSQLHWISGQVIVAVVLIGLGVALFSDGSGPSGVDAVSGWLRRTFTPRGPGGPVPPPPSPSARTIDDAPPPAPEPVWPPTTAYGHPYMGAHQAPTPTPVAPRPPRERSALGAITLALWLFAMGGAALANRLGIFALTLPRAAALTVLVAGVGLLVGTFVGRARGLIAVGLIASTVWVIATLAVQIDVGVPLSGGVGERTHAPTTVEQLTDYRLAAGELTVDLSGIDLDGESAPVSASVALGELRVIVPDDVTVRASGGVRAGEYAILGSDQSGTGLTFDIDDPGVEGAGVLYLELDSGAGTITVTREDAQ